MTRPGIFERLFVRLGLTAKQRSASAPPAFSHSTAPSEVEVQERTKLHDTFRDELFRRQLSNSENLDKAILTLSSAGLGVSLTFLKDFVRPATPQAPGLLHWSWYLFVTAVVLTVLSFIFSQRGIRRQLTLNARYYLQFDESAASERNVAAIVTEWVGYAAAFVFAGALVCTIIFVRLNAEKGAAMTTDPKSIAQDGALVTPVQRVRDGAPVTTIQKVPQAELGKGSLVPGIQKVPSKPVTTTSSSGGNQPSTPTSTSGSSGAAPGGKQ